jgi:predicted AAA+ superfamily ATPase
VHFDIYYYKTAGNLEVDFLVQNQDRKLFLIQVCDTLAHPLTRQREISALQHAMRELQLSESMIITKEEREQISVKEGNIDIIPVWQFLLEKQFS